MVRLIVFISLFFFSLMSCTSERGKFAKVDLSNSCMLDSPEIVYEFKDKFPVSLTVRDSLAYLIQVKSDTCMSLLNINSGEMISSFGTVGHGENDLLNPNFILSIDEEDVLLDVGNLRKLMRVGYANDSVSLSEYMPYPDSLFISGELNLSKNYIVGRKIDAYDKNMFYIYDRNTASICNIPCYPQLEHPIRDYNSVYAPVLAFSEAKKRIIAGMYFFDLFHVYDLSGRRINSFRFSDDYLPDIKERNLDIRQGYSGIIRAFPTEDHCYLLRMVEGAQAGFQKFMLIKLDWDGKLMKSYQFKNHIVGQFYIDEEDSKIYTIERKVDESECNEVFSVVSYDL